MSKFPSKPTRGQRALQAIYNAVCQIIDYLPSLEVRGDNTTTSVTHSSAGTIIHSKQNLSSPKKQVVEGGQGGQQYFADNDTLRLQVIGGNNTFSIRPKYNGGQLDTTKNYALVCLSGVVQWVQLEDCN